MCQLTKPGKSLFIYGIIRPRPQQLQSLFGVKQKGRCDATLFFFTLKLIQLAYNCFLIMLLILILVDNY